MTASCVLSFSDKILMAQKGSVMLTRSDLLTDIDCNFNNKSKEKCDKDDCHDMDNNDADYPGRESNDESNDLENNDLEMPSSGFSPVSFYGSKKQNFTARTKSFSPSAHKRLINKDKVLPIPNKDSPGVKRKTKRQSSSSAVKKKRRTSNVARQCKTGGNKQKPGSISNGNCSYMFEKESLISKPSGNDAVIENKDETDLCQSVTGGAEVSSSEGILSLNLAYKSAAATAGDSSPHESEGSVSDRLVLVPNKACFSNLSEVESACSEASLCSGPGSVIDGLFLRKNGNEYFFANSTGSNSPVEQLESCEINKDRAESISNGLMSSTHQSKEHLTVETPVCDFTNESPSSLSFSLPSPNTSESDVTLKLSERDTDSSSTKSSPEHQVSITRYFKSITGSKSRTKLTANGISSSGMSSTENSPDTRNRLAYYFALTIVMHVYMRGVCKSFLQELSKFLHADWLEGIVYKRTGNKNDVRCTSNVYVFSTDNKVFFLCYCKKQSMVVFYGLYSNRP